MNENTLKLIEQFKTLPEEQQEIVLRELKELKSAAKIVEH